MTTNSGAPVVSAVRQPARRPLSFGMTVLAATIGALIASVLLGIVTFVWLDHQIDQAKKSLTPAVSGDMPQPTPSSRAEEECWGKYFEGQGAEDFKTFARKHCPGVTP